MPEYKGKYLFISNVRTEEGLASQILGYDTAKEAEIKFFDEVSYGLKSDGIILAHYIVVNEYGVKLGDLERIIDNQIPIATE